VSGSEAAVVDAVPLIDGHAHLLLSPAAAAAQPFARFFTEAHDADTIGRHTPHTLLYRWAVRELAALLGCPATEEAVVTARAALPFGDYLRRLLTHAGVATVLVDDGYPRAEALPARVLTEAAGVRVHRVARIERLAEDLILAHATIDDLCAALIAELERAGPDLVGLKSIIAYRSGLILGEVDRDEAARALARVRATWPGVGGRLTAKPLLDYLLVAAAEWAAARGLPLQIHTGFGDRDLDLRLANPLHLRPHLERGVLAQLPVVLLHAGYPFVRAAAYLASVYPNVYVDISLATPLLVGPALTRVLEELLALAPVTKLLYGSDAWGVPEWLWLAARAGRQALAVALAWLPAAEAGWAARRILHDNAAELYRL
jgi:hypothetical protein